MLLILLWSCGEPELPASAAAFCEDLPLSADADAVGVSCVDEPTLDDDGRPRSCDELQVMLVAKGEVDDLCARCVAAGAVCERTPAIECSTAGGAPLSVYSFLCR